MIEFFMDMQVPTTTHQQKQVNFKTKRFYEDDKLKAARSKLMAHLGQHVPKEKYTSAVRLTTWWCFGSKTKKDGTYKTTRPDLDNLQKLLLDCMTKCVYWTDDALVVSMVVEKYWSKRPGIYVKVEEL